MNCKTFHGLLYDYLDEAMDAEVEAAARQRLELCDACRNAFLREQAISNSMRKSLNEATACLSVRPGMRQNVLKALESKPAPLSAWLDALRSFIAVRPAGAVAALLGVALLLLCMRLYRQAPNHAARTSVAQTGHSPCVINVPLLTRTHVFRLQGNAVVDSIVDEPGIADAGDSEDGGQLSPKPKLDPL